MKNYTESRKQESYTKFSKKAASLSALIIEELHFFPLPTNCDKQIISPPLTGWIQKSDVDDRPNFPRAPSNPEQLQDEDGNRPPFNRL